MDKWPRTQEVGMEECREQAFQHCAGVSDLEGWPVGGEQEGGDIGRAGVISSSCVELEEVEE